tara:strand:- start:981 stop:1571 length:591 start_codon:yes stop_codon:yes gene_type:complete
MKKILKDQDIKIDSMLRDGVSIEKPILMNPIYGLFVLYRAKRILQIEIESIESAIENDDDLGNYLLELNAEYDGDIIRIYSYVSDDMFSVSDEKIVKNIKQDLFNNVYSKMIDNGAIGTFSDKINMNRWKVNPSDVGEIRGVIQSDEMRRVDIEIYPSYLMVPQKIKKLILKSFGIWIFYISLLLLAFFMLSKLTI